MKQPDAKDQQLLTILSKEARIPLKALAARVDLSRSAASERVAQIFVTHDQEEALSMSDRVVVTHQRIADQVGTPFEIHNRPATRFVAQFVGTLT